MLQRRVPLHLEHQCRDRPYLVSWLFGSTGVFWCFSEIRFLLEIDIIYIYQALFCVFSKGQEWESYMFPTSLIRVLLWNILVLKAAHHTWTCQSGSVPVKFNQCIFLDSCQWKSRFLSIYLLLLWADLRFILGSSRPLFQRKPKFSLS